VGVQVPLRAPFWRNLGGLLEGGLEAGIY